MVRLAKDALGENKGLICEYPLISTAVLETAASYAEKIIPKDVAKKIAIDSKIEQEEYQAMFGLSKADYNELTYNAAKIFSRGNSTGQLVGEVIALEQNPTDIEKLLKKTKLDQLTVGENAIADAVDEFCQEPPKPLKTPPAKPISDAVHEFGVAPKTPPAKPIVAKKAGFLTPQ